SADHRGTFAGVIEKIPYLKELGVTAVELMPVYESDPQDGQYWGYMPLNFFSPSSFLSSRRDAIGELDEFRAMIKALHAADIEVLLDVVYNHTTEGDARGPTYSYRGCADRTWYLVGADNSYWSDHYTGTGNTLNIGNPFVRRMVIESMRFWVKVMHVDGF